MSYPYEPDYVVAPAATLREWLVDKQLPPTAFMVLCGGLDGYLLEGTARLVQDVLDKQPLTEAHAQLIEQGTKIPARFWLALEHNYREGLAAGKKDVT